MTNNGADNGGNFGNIVYDSGSEVLVGKHRIGTSATEIELLNDLPPPVGAGITTAENGISDQARVFDTHRPSSSDDKQNQSNNYHTLSLNRGQPSANVMYQDGHDHHLHSAVDKLLEKYAPDAAPPNLLNSTTSRRPPNQTSVSTAYDEPIVSTFQTNIPLSTAPHNYSAIIRPKTGASSQSQTQIDNNRQPSTGPRPASTYDSFQHSVPQSQQQQQSKPSVSIKTKNGHVSQVVPGKLYTLDDDPLHLLYDRQNPIPSNSQSASRQQPSFQTTFQPSNNTQHIQDPLAALFTNTSQRHPQQAPSATTDTNANGTHPFDLGNLIKRVQQDYLREIQPFVSSVKFVEKDREFGQNLNDIGFTTPVTIRKGFIRQADDILRRSFGGQEHQRKGTNHYDDDYSDDDDDNVNELRSSHRPHPLQKFDSKQSFTSVTSVSTHGSDYDERNVSLNNKKKKANVHDQGTSPPPQFNQKNIQSQAQKLPGVAPYKSMTTNDTDDEEETTRTDLPPGVKLATRISSGQRTLSYTESVTSYSQDDYTATYNEHDVSESSPARPAPSVSALVTNTAIIQPASAATRDQLNAGRPAQQRSEDIHPTPPTIRPSTNSQTLMRKTDSEGSGTAASGSDEVSESDDEPQSAAPAKPMPLSSTSRSNIPQTNARGVPAENPPSTSRGQVENNARQAAGATANPPSTSRGPVENNARQAAGAAANPPTTARSAVEPNARAAVANPPSTSRGPVETNARQAAGAAANPPTTARTTVETNARDAGANAPSTSRTAANPNIPFVPPDQRAAQTASANPPASTTAPAAQTGSTRFFQSDADQKGKRSLKDAPAAFGNKIKSLFRRK